MGRLFIILLRLLFPLDPVARYRELMRTWLRMVMDSVADPEEIESLAYWAEDRAKLERAICFLEYFMRCLIHDRARQLLGLTFVYAPLQPAPHIRHPKSLNQLFRRLTQLARDFHNLDKLAARRAQRMQRERDSDPLRLAASPQSSTLRVDPASLRLVEANSPLQLNARFASTTSQKWGRWIGASSRRDGGGGAFIRGPPTLSISEIQPHPPRTHLRERTRARQSGTYPHA